MTADEIQATNDAKAAAAHDEMIDKLRGTTALGRLALVEVRTIFAKLAELGYTIVEPNNG